MNSKHFNSYRYTKNRSNSNSSSIRNSNSNSNGNSNENNKVLACSVDLVSRLSNGVYGAAYGLLWGLIGDKK